MDAGLAGSTEVVSNNVFLKSIGRSQLPHKSVNVSFTITHKKNTLTNSCGNRLSKNDFRNTVCEIRVSFTTPTGS